MRGKKGKSRNLLFLLQRSKVHVSDFELRVPYKLGLDVHADVDCGWVGAHQWRHKQRVYAGKLLTARSGSASLARDYCAEHRMHEPVHPRPTFVEHAASL